MTIREMAEELGVTGRTIRRDLDVFRGVGFPLEEAVGDRGRKTWRIEASRDLPRLSFSYDEAIALALGRRMLEPLEGTPFGEAAGHAFEKIRALFGSSTLEYIEQFAAIFHDTGGRRRDPGRDSDLIDGLRTAIEDGLAARLLYRSERAAEATGREVHPLGLVLHGHALYLIAFDPGSGIVKHYKVARIERVEIGSPAQPRPEVFDLAGYMDSAFAVYRDDGEPGEVTVRFGPSAARYVQESRWHRSQQISEQSDGSLIARFRVRGTEEIKSWILGFGPKAVVLGPESLRAEIARELRSLVEAYEASSDAGRSPVGSREDSRPDRRAVLATNSET